MEETKKAILAYMAERYGKTKWAFHTQVRILAQIKGDVIPALKELYSEGLVLPREGAQGQLWEYILTDERKEIVKRHYLKTNK